jgi:mannitol-specific phosphotransferase system IIBC component
MDDRDRSLEGGADAGGWQREPQRLTLEAVAAAAGISAEKLRRIVAHGLVSPVAPGSSDLSMSAVARLKRMLRLHASLGVSLTSAAIIADLLERMERMEWELDRVERTWGARPGSPTEMWPTEERHDDTSR